MIPALDELEPEEATDVLTRAAALVLPNPRVDPPQTSQADARAAVLVERLKQHVGKKKTQSAVIDEVLDILTARLTKPYLQDDKLPAIRARLTDRGLLPLQTYQFIYHPSYETLAVQTKIRHSHVEDAVFRPSAQQYFQPTDYGMAANGLPPMALFVKEHTNLTHGNFSLLVHCAFDKDKLIVGQAVRIYREDLERPENDSPLALFRAFLQKYGATFRFGQGPTRQLFMYETFSTLKVGKVPVKIFVSDMDSVHFSENSLFRPSILGAVEIAFSYIIKLDPYLLSLQRHGVPADTSPEAMRRAQHSNTLVHLST